jgi:hypothetical protein
MAVLPPLTGILLLAKANRPGYRITLDAGGIPVGVEICA